MTKASDNLFPKVILEEVASDGSATTTPAADYRALFLGEDGALHLKDSAAAVTGITVAEILDIPTAETDDTLVLAPDGAGGVEFRAETGGGGGPVYDIERYTAGDITISTTTAGADLSGVADVVVAAATGDLLMVGASARVESSNTSSLRFDVKFITGATENYVSSLTTTPAGQGISAWFLFASEEYQLSGEIPYVVQAADISGGNCTLSLRAWLSGAQNWVISADSDAPVLFWVRNLGQ